MFQFSEMLTHDAPDDSPEGDQLVSLFHKFVLGSSLGKNGRFGEVHHVINRQSNHSDVVRIISLDDGKRRRREKFLTTENVYKAS